MLSAAELEQAVAELRSLRDLTLWGASQFQRFELFFGHGTSNAYDESAFLAAYGLALGPAVAEGFQDCRLTRPQRERIVELFAQRIQRRCPAAYLVGEAWFSGLPFFVDERVLVPRSPLAEWVERRFRPFVVEREDMRILDMCTGSGCLAVALALAFPDAIVDASDISRPALTVAAGNVARHGLDDRINVLHADLFEGLGQQYDLIVCNPPYVDAEELAAMPAEYRHEPELGLRAGGDGLDIVRRILGRAKTRLKPEGVLVVEVGLSAAAVVHEWPDAPFNWLDFERGGEGVFLLDRIELDRFDG